MNENDFIFPSDWKERWEKRDKDYSRIIQILESVAIQSKENENKIAELNALLHNNSLEWEKRNAETDRIVKANAKQIGGIDRSNGLMAEETIYNSLSKEKIFANIRFDEIERNVQIQSERFHTVGGIDLIMLNGDTISLIEVKYKVEKKDIKKLLTSKMPLFKQYFPTYSTHKIILGIGGMSFEKEVEIEAKENGIAILKIVGDNVEFYTDNITIY